MKEDRRPPEPKTLESLLAQAQFELMRVRNLLARLTPQDNAEQRDHDRAKLSVITAQKLLQQTEQYTNNKAGA